MDSAIRVRDHYLKIGQYLDTSVLDVRREMSRADAVLIPGNLPAWKADVRSLCCELFSNLECLIPCFCQPDGGYQP